MDLGDLRRGPGGGVHALARLRRVQARARARSGGRPRRDPFGTGGHGSRHHEPGPGEHPEPRGRLRGRRARHLPVGEHDRDPDPGSVEQHRAATEHGHLLHRRPRREQLRVLAGPVRRRAGAQGVHRRVASHPGLPAGRERSPAQVLRLATGGGYRERRDHLGPEAERGAIGERVDVGVVHGLGVGFADRRTPARRIGVLPDGPREHRVEVLSVAWRRRGGPQGHHVEGHEDLVVHPGSDRVVEPEPECDAERVGLPVEEGEGERVPESVGGVDSGHGLFGTRRQRRPAPALRFRIEGSCEDRTHRLHDPARDDPVLRVQLAEREPRLLHHAGGGRRAPTRDGATVPARPDREDRAPRGTVDPSDRRADRPELRVDPGDVLHTAGASIEGLPGRRAGPERRLVLLAGGRLAARREGASRTGRDHRKQHHESLRAADRWDADRPDHAMGRGVHPG